MDSNTQYVFFNPENSCEKELLNTLCVFSQAFHDDENIVVSNDDVGRFLYYIHQIFQTRQGDVLTNCNSSFMIFELYQMGMFREEWLKFEAVCKFVDLNIERDETEGKNRKEDIAQFLKTEVSEKSAMHFFRSKQEPAIKNDKELKKLPRSTAGRSDEDTSSTSTESQQIPVARDSSSTKTHPRDNAERKLQEGNEVRSTSSRGKISEMKKSPSDADKQDDFEAMTDPEQEPLLVHMTVTQLILYSIFMTIFCVVASGMVIESKNHLAKEFTQLFVEEEFGPSEIGFEDITLIEDIWDYLEDVFVPNLYWNHWYGEDKMQELDEDSRNILYENKLLGVPRLRQVKVRNDSCKIQVDFQRTFTSCYDSYSANAEDKAPFGLMEGSAWTYHSPEELGLSSYRGLLATYKGGGYFEDLSRNENESMNKIKELKNNLWITRGTRAILIDFTVYNANLNLFCVNRLLFELPPTGGVFPSWSFRAVKLFRYLTPSDKEVLGCEFVLTAFLLYFTILEIVEVSLSRLKYFKSVRNILDATFIVSGWTCFGLNIYRHVIVGKTIDNLLSNDSEHSSFQWLATLQTRFNNALAVCLFLAWMKAFEYLDITKVMIQLGTTLARCGKDIIAFSVVFFTVFFAFAQLGYLLFGMQTEDFNSPAKATVTLIRIILGDFSFEEVEKTNRLLGPLYFLVFVFFIYFMLLNMFLAIVTDTYSNVKGETSQQIIRIKFYGQIRDFFTRITGLKKRTKPPTEGKGEIDYDEVKCELKRCKFSNFEIERFLSKHNISREKPIKKKDADIILEAAAAYNNETEETLLPEDNITEKPGVPSEKFYRLKTRVDQLERSIIVLVREIDIMLGVRER